MTLNIRIGQRENIYFPCIIRIYVISPKLFVDEKMLLLPCTAVFFIQKTLKYLQYNLLFNTRSILQAATNRCHPI